MRTEIVNKSYSDQNKYLIKHIIQYNYIPLWKKKLFSCISKNKHALIYMNRNSRLKDASKMRKDNNKDPTHLKLTFSCKREEGIKQIDMSTVPIFME